MEQKSISIYILIILARICYNLILFYQVLTILNMESNDSASTICVMSPVTRKRGEDTRGWKNAVLNLFNAILKAIKSGFSQITFIPEKNQLHVVSILTLCLLAKDKLSLFKLKKFEDIVVKIVGKKVNFQQRKLQRLQDNPRTTQRELNDHWKSIRILNRLKSISITLIQYNGTIEVKYLEELLTLIFSQCQAHQVGQPGRQAIQQNKIKNSIRSIKKALRETIQQQGIQTEEESGSNDPSNSANRVSRNQIGVQANETELIAGDMNENTNEKGQEVVHNKEREQYWQELQGEYLMDIITRPSSDLWVENLTDFFTWKQQEEIKIQVVLKCNDIQSQSQLLSRQ